jgi:hypothetical protein
VNPTWPFPSPVQREKGQFTCRQTSRSGDGIIRGSSWKSDKHINATNFFKSRRRPIHLDFLRWKLRPGNFRSAQFFSGLLGESITRFATKWINRTGKQVERVVPWPAVALAKATQRVGNCGPAASNFLDPALLRKIGLRQFHRLEDKPIHLDAGLRLTLAGYLGLCRSPRSK